MKKPTKLIALLLSVLLMATLFAGCAQPEEPETGEPAEVSASAEEPVEASASAEAPAEGEPEGAAGKRVMVVHMTLSDPAWTYLDNIMNEKFTEAGFEYASVSGEGDPLVQIEQIENAVVQGYDAIVVVPLTGEAIADACQRAMDDGVVVYSFINDSVYHTVFRTVDAAYSGQIAVQYAAEWAIDYFGDNGDGTINAVLLGNDSDSTQKARFDAAVEKLGEYPQLNIVDIRSVEPDMTVGQAAAENIMTLNPDTLINLWICLDSSQAIGANAAIMAEVNNNGMDITQIGLVSTAMTEDSAAQLRMSLNGESAYRIIAANAGDTALNVQQIAEQLVAIFNGEPYDEFSPVNVDLVTPENVSDFGF